jgi:hypothetical protein
VMLWLGGEVAVACNPLDMALSECFAGVWHMCCVRLEDLTIDLLHLVHMYLWKIINQTNKYLLCFPSKR